MTDPDSSRRLKQTLTGLLCALALYLLAWNEVPGAGRSLLDLLGNWIHPALALPDARTEVRIVAGLLAISGSFFCIAGMGNTLGLIPLFGGRIALSARLAGAVLGTLLALAAAVLGHYSDSAATATLLITPLASILLALLWLSRRGSAPLAPLASSHPAPIMLDMPDRSTPAAARRQEPTVPVAAPRASQPASFTARAPRQNAGQSDLSPLEFQTGPGAGSNRARQGSTSGSDLGLPPLEFTPQQAPAPAPRQAPAPAPAPPAPAPRPVAPTVPPRATPLRIEDGLPPLDFPTPLAPRPPPPVQNPIPTPAAAPTLDTMDFSPARRAPVAPLADELAQWNPRPGASLPPAPVITATSPVPAQSGRPAPAPPKAALRPIPDELPEDLPPGAQTFMLDTVTPREQGPRRALLDEEPDLLAQLGSLSQVQTPPAAPVSLPSVSPPSMSSTPEPPARPATPTLALRQQEPERVKLADKGVFSIYKLIEAGVVIGYALTEHGVTVSVGTQEQVKQTLRERWPGSR